MDRYDFGYSLEKGSTNEWAFNIIEDESLVLELGPAVGNLTYHLANDKKCIVDIVEIDEESGKKAEIFAREALLGEDYGNLNKTLWFELLKGRKYDRVVVLDVLEHLEKPKEVLNCLKELLKDEGQIILSIPNIAHNAIILELLKNQFPYSKLGLLDSTHIHFFSYYSILDMIREVDLHISTIDAIKKVISDTEFICSYTEVPLEIAYYLRTRKFGDVYQYLMVLGKRKREINDCLQNGILDVSLYKIEVLMQGKKNDLISVYGNLNNINLNINMEDYPNANTFVFVPTKLTCLINNLYVYMVNEKGERKELQLDYTTGIQLDQHTFIVSDGRHEISYVLKKDAKAVQISASGVIINDKVYQNYVMIERQKLQSNEKMEELSQQIVNEKQINEELSQQILSEKQINEELSQQIANEKQMNDEKIKELDTIIDINTKELEQIKNTLLYRIFKKLNLI